MYRHVVATESIVDISRALHEDAQIVESDSSLDLSEGALDDVLQLDGVRLQLKASESVEIELPSVAINGSEAVEIAGGDVKIHGEEEVEVEAEGDVRVRGKIIHLN